MGSIYYAGMKAYHSRQSLDTDSERLPAQLQALVPGHTPVLPALAMMDTNNVGIPPPAHVSVTKKKLYADVCSELGLFRPRQVLDPL